MLIDASAWIEFVRRTGRVIAKERVAHELSNGHAVFTCPTQFELLSNCTRQKERDLLEDLLRMSRHEPFLPDDWRAATDTGLKLARRGLRVPSFDLLVAVVAARLHLKILTLDAHFQMIKEAGLPALEIERIEPDATRN